ncbi:MAG: phosphoadenylyl-sulfate reductase [Gammaproteobacteria bacterium]|nr:phosphoadenylyl-sulfate reductase [Gammaproteobacteria bacterium]|tara:strand:- start:1431 stop:2153 length:723 start_codon:yes stop_codon:yes gene_type:complete
MINAENIVEINEKFNNMEPREILQQVLADIPGIVVSFSGAEDVALVVMAWKLHKDIKVFTLDTGRLHVETYRFIDQVRQKYDLDLAFLYPDTTAIQRLTSDKGLFSFYQDGHEECCSIRKTEPLRRQLAGVDAWITGQRKDQSPTRTDVPVAQLDTVFAAPGKTLLKFNPFANWRSKDVWDYIRMFDLPYNPLHDQGFVSIGCQPCTRPIGPNQHEREGRWWWEEATAKECGLHRVNIIE